MHSSEKNNRTIVLMNNKGGVGKTTMAFYLAKNYLRNGRRVTCIDFDQQSQLKALLPEITTDSNTQADEIHEIEADYVIVDTGPTFSLDHIELMDMADLIVIPTPLDFLDVSQTVKLLKTMAKTGNANKAKIVITHNGTNTIIYKSLMPLLESYSEQLNIEIVAVMRKSQKVVQGMMDGKTVFEIQSPPEIRSSFKDLFKEINKSLVELSPLDDKQVMKNQTSKGDNGCQTRV